MATFLDLPPELHLSILTHLRAVDLGLLSLSCKSFSNPQLIQQCMDHFATKVYPPNLTEGYDTPIICGVVPNGNNESTSTLKESDSPGSYDPLPKFKSFELLRDMEMLVVARVLSRPEPSLTQRSESGCFYVSKTWCRSALRWLEDQAEERKEREHLRIKKVEEERLAALDAADVGRGRGKGKGKHYHHKHHSQQKSPPGKKKKKGLKKLERAKAKKRIGAGKIPEPSPTVNDDIVCEHGGLSASNCAEGGGRSSRAKRRVLDKQAWRTLKKLYPEGLQLNVLHGECMQCKLEAEAARRNSALLKKKEMEERKKPLSCPLVRGFYLRNRGVPSHCLRNSKTDDGTADVLGGLEGRNSSLVPGVYNVLPRSWCHRWRKYIKNGEGTRPHAPDTSACLCDAHRLPLIPPHLEAFLYGETSSLLSVSNNNLMGSTYGSSLEDGRLSDGGHVLSLQRPLPVGLYPVDEQLGRADNSSLRTANSIHTVEALRVSGVSEAEIQSQRLAMLQLEEQQQRRIREQNERYAATSAVEDNMTPEERQAYIKAQLDRQNKVVVEILTDEEFNALQKWWPDIHSNYALKFAIVENEDNSGKTEVIWTTSPCRECEPSGSANHDFVVRNRSRIKGKNTPKKK